MKTAIILHGMPDKDEFYNPASPSPSNKQWLPWIQRQLSLRDILTQTPELPRPYEPNYQVWKQVFEQFHLDEETILIGHSCGAGFLARWLSENPTKVAQLILVGPWIDPDNEEFDKVGDFFEFTIDPTVQDRVGEISIFISDDEPYADVTKSANILHATWPKSELIKMHGMGHFCLDEMGTEAFPELLNKIK